MTQQNCCNLYVFSNGQSNRLNYIEWLSLQQFNSILITGHENTRPPVVNCNGKVRVYPWVMLTSVPACREGTVRSWWGGSGRGWRGTGPPPPSEPQVRQERSETAHQCRIIHWPRYFNLHLCKPTEYLVHGSLNLLPWLGVYTNHDAFSKIFFIWNNCNSDAAMLVTAMEKVA